MPEFLRKPKHGEIKDGEAFTDVIDGEVVAQKAKYINGELLCLEVRKSVVNKDGTAKADKDRHKIIEKAKKEVAALYKSKVETKKKSTRTKSPKKSTKSRKSSKAGRGKSKTRKTTKKK